MQIRRPALPRIGWYPVVALTALAFGFFFATQLRSQLIPPSAQVARNQALVGTVQSLERDNAASRARVAARRVEIATLEARLIGIGVDGLIDARDRFAVADADAASRAGHPAEIVELAGEITDEGRGVAGHWVEL